MRITILLPVVLFAITGFAQNKLPIIDMHLHALPAALNGPPPTAICAPPEEMPVHDPAKSWAEGFNQYHLKMNYKHQVRIKDTSLLSQNKRERQIRLAKYNIAMRNNLFL